MLPDRKETPRLVPGAPQAHGVAAGGSCQFAKIRGRRSELAVWELTTEPTREIGAVAADFREGSRAGGRDSVGGGGISFPG